MPDFDRLNRPASLTRRVEQLLRQAIAEGRFAGGKLPTEMELAEQIGVSRETVRLAAETLQREGLLVKIRRKGTFLAAPQLPEQIETASVFVGYLQAGYPGPQGQDEVSRVMSGLMLQGALEEADRAELQLAVRHAPHTRMGQAFRQLSRSLRLRGLIFASYGEEKLLRQASGLNLPIVLLDHDMRQATAHSIRDDSFAAAREAVAYLAGLGHRRIAFVNWHQTELNPWRLQGYRQGMREAGLPRRRSWELAAELTAAGAARSASGLLALTPRPTAVYCFTNTLARLLIEELRRRGVRVPEDVSVMGGGGEEAPGIACHQADWHQMGRLAMQVLLRAPAEPEHHVCPHTIYPGSSAARMERG